MRRQPKPTAITRLDAVVSKLLWDRKNANNIEAAAALDHVLSRLHEYTDGDNYRVGLEDERYFVGNTDVPDGTMKVVSGPARLTVNGPETARDNSRCDDCEFGKPAETVELDNGLVVDVFLHGHLRAYHPYTGDEHRLTLTHERGDVAVLRRP